MTALADTLDSKPFPDTELLGYQPRNIVLLGAGPTHLHLLGHLAKHPLVGATLTLITPHSHQVFVNQVPRWMTGNIALDNCSMALEPLVRRAGVRWLHRNVGGLDVPNNTVYLDDGQAIHFDLLSVNTGPLHNRVAIEQALPGARQHALFALPCESFSVLWPQVVEISQQRALRVAVLGEGAYAVDLAMAVRQAMPSASVTLVAGPRTVGYYAPSAMQLRIAQTLKKRQITVLQDTATALDGSAVMLGCGAALACDVPLYAGAAQAAPWVVDSGLVTDAHGFIAVDPCRRSSGQPHIWSMDTHHTLHTSETDFGSPLAANLAAAVQGQALRPALAAKPRLQTQGCGGSYAIAAWGPMTFEGRWVGWLQQHLDHQALARWRSAT